MMTLAQNRKCNILITILIISCFMPTNIAYGLVQNSSAQPLEPTYHAIGDSVLLSNIYIPESFGSIDNLWQTDINLQTPQKVILINDAHCNYEAQKNIAKILETLISDYKVDLVCIEGTEGKVDTSTFQSFPYKEIREKTADKYIKKGLFSGTSNALFCASPLLRWRGSPHTGP